MRGFRIAFAVMALALVAVSRRPRTIRRGRCGSWCRSRAGAGNDLLGRLLAAELTKRLNAQVFVENKPGAASQLGTDLVAKSPADGYTLL